MMRSLGKSYDVWCKSITVSLAGLIWGKVRKIGNASQRSSSVRNDRHPAWLTRVEMAVS
jgi:hypothetical protein